MVNIFFSLHSFKNYKMKIQMPSVELKYSSSSLGSKMFSTSLHNISRFKRNDSTVRMGHKERMDTIDIGEGSVGQDLGISLSFSLSIEVPISIVSPGGKVVGSSHSVSMVVRSHCAVNMVNKLSLGVSLAIKMSVSLASQVLDCGIVVGSVERSHRPVEMVDQLRVSLGISLTVMSKPESQVVVSGSQGGVVYRGHSSSKVTNKLTIRGGGKAAQDQKFHGDFWS